MKKRKFSITKASFVYTLLCNIPICLCIGLAANLSANNFSSIDGLSLLINFAVSFPIAFAVGLFVPLVKIGKWFTGLFKVPHDTYTGNIGYRLLATVCYTIIYFIVLNPFLAVFNGMILGDQSFEACFHSWLINIPLMLAVGFFSTLIFDIPAYHIAHKIDPNF